MARDGAAGSRETRGQCGASATGGGVWEFADPICGIDAAAIAAPRSIANTEAARLAVVFVDEAGASEAEAFLDSIGGWFDGVIVTESFLHAQSLGTKRDTTGNAHKHAYVWVGRASRLAALVRA